jgi:hypothetical protein
LFSLPREIIDEYNLLELAHDGRVYIEIQKGMYGLPQAGILTNELLQRWLDVDGFHPTEHIQGLWKHENRLVWFLLVVDYSSIKYVGCENAEHLMTPIKKKYEISSDLTGSAYCGLKNNWDCANSAVDLSMNGYTNAALHKYQHPAHVHAEHAQHKCNSPVYGAKTQYIEDDENSPSLSPKYVNRLQ